MADDAQFDPLAGIMTPQMLAMARYQQQQQAVQAANADNTPVGAMIGGARAAGLSLGNGIGNLAGPNPNDLASRIAQQNQQILMSDPSQGQQPQGGSGAPAPTQGPTGAAPADPYETAAQQYEGKARQFLQAGQFDTAHKFVAMAQIVRKQGADMAKTQAEQYKDQNQGDEAKANQNELKASPNPASPTGLEWVSVSKDGKTVTPTGKWAPPQVPQTSIALKEAAPFVQQFAKETSDASKVADQATQNLAMIHDMKDRAAAGLIAGTGSNFRQSLSTALETAGLANTDPKLSNTQAFQAEGLKMALVMKQSGMRLTQQEIQWFRAAQAGNLEYTPETLKTQLDLMQRGAEAQFAPYNTRAKAVAALAKSDSSYAPVATMYPEREVPQYVPSTPKAAAPADKFSVGQKYTSNGVTKTYKGNGVFE